jgi:cytochrome c oxidase subunit 2
VLVGALLLSAALGTRLPAADEPEVRSFSVKASRYAFEPARITVQSGDVVELVMRSADTDHGLAIKALGVKVAIPKGGAPVTARFVAKQPGRFPMECSEYCGSGHKRMRGELVVEEAAR